MIGVLYFIFALNTASAGPLKAWWTNFCERHLIAEDPYQFESLSVDELVTAYHRVESKALVREIRARLETDLSYEDREILTKTIGGNL